ncbi:hypothetical protein JY96_09515 [Aquabacterium sp. NJ1]|uniref:TolC family protein n=1 Tax=Aquabacterium sp. NJ1 TaxID=1538295 RepID=UPI00052E17F2|nr:TolC family protein [Aquabacterium sp. NJ1]KGM40191.1 hypothetical protein JY96_09515 [Aquabacterium sp. NJ1]
MTWTPLLRCLQGSVLLSLAACTHTAPTDAVSPLLSDARMAPVQARMATGGAYEERAWWNDVGGPVLDKLVMAGLQSSTDVRIALTRVQEARAGLQANEALLAPSVTANAGYLNKRSGLPAPVKQGLPDTRMGQVSIGLDWDIDVFGRNRALASAAQHDVQASEAGVAGARLMLIGEVTRQYVLNQGASRRLALLDELMAKQEKILAINGHRFDEGESSILAVTEANAQLAQMRAQRHGLLTLQAVTCSHLARLTGLFPDEVRQMLAAERARASSMSLPPSAPAGQPVELLGRRPDIMAAKATWQAEYGRLDSAKADKLPRFFLSLLTGREDLRLNGMDLAPVGFHQTSLLFALPLFNAGRIDAGIKAQSAQAQRAELRYEQAVRQAVDDVESALSDLEQARARTSELARAAQERQQAAQRGAHLLREGQIALLDALQLEQAYLSASLGQAESLEALQLSHIQAQVALGGGWRAATASAEAIDQKGAQP